MADAQYDRSLVPADMWKRMAAVLNSRGFVTHNDFMIGTERLFPGNMKRCEHLLRAAGYNGDPLQEWSTAYRLERKGGVYDYGVLDPAWSLTTDLLDAYTLATSGEFSHLSDLLVRQLPDVDLGLKMRCACGHTAVLYGPPLARQSRRSIWKVTGTCTKCGAKGVQVHDVERLFDDYP